MDKKIILKPVRNSGFIFEKEQEKDYIKKRCFNPDMPLGAESPLDEPPVVFEDGHGWHNEGTRAEPEMQFNRHFDSYSCVIFAIAKSLVAYLNKVYGVKTTISEMYGAFVGKVKPYQGTSIKNGLEGFRIKGWVKDEDYPFTPETTLKQFFAKPPLEIQIKAKGKLTKWKVHWEQIAYSGNVDHGLIISSLRKTPVIGTGFAWASYYGEGIYYDYNNQANHAFLIDDWADEKDYDLIAYDNYPQDNQFDTDSKAEEFEKKLARNYKIWSAHRVWLTPVNNSIISKIMDYFVRLKNGTIYWGKSNTNKIQMITKENAGFAAITHIMRKDGESAINIDDDKLKDYEITEEFFGKEELGINKKL